MKNFTLLLLFSIFAIRALVAQNISFPDSNFKAALIIVGVDTGGDGEISKDEAEAMTALNILIYNISDLSGIEHFINLVNLNCSHNNLTSVDVS